MSGKVIEGVPELRWGKECTFIGALESAILAVGEKTDYVELMGMSGAAFRMRFHQPEWCPSSPDMFPRDHSVEFLGYGMKEYGLCDEKLEKADILKLIKESIDRRKPVVAIDLVKIPDWGLIAGYADDKLLVRDYWDAEFPQLKTIEEIWKGEYKDIEAVGDYVLANKFPWIIFTIGEKGEVPDKEESVRKTLKRAVGDFKPERSERFPKYANGPAAFDAWARDLEDEERFTSMDKEKLMQHWHVNGWCYDSLHDARASAHGFLRRVTDLFEGEEAEAVESAANIYEEVAKLIFENWVYSPFPFWANKTEEGKIWIPGDRLVDGTEWTEEMRKKAAATLREIKEKEQAVMGFLNIFCE